MLISNRAIRPYGPLPHEKDYSDSVSRRRLIFVMRSFQSFALAKDTACRAKEPPPVSLKALSPSLSAAAINAGGESAKVHQEEYRVSSRVAIATILSPAAAYSYSLTGLMASVRGSILKGITPTSKPRRYPGKC